MVTVSPPSPNTVYDVLGLRIFGIKKEKGKGKYSFFMQMMLCF